MAAAQDIIDLTVEALLLAVSLAAPIVAAALAASLISAVIQVVTKVSEPSLSTLPRIILTIVAVVVAAPWIGTRAAAFAERAWGLLQAIHT